MKVELNLEMCDELDKVLDAWAIREVKYSDVVSILEAKLFSVYVDIYQYKWREELIHKINTTHFGEGCPCCGGNE